MSLQAKVVNQFEDINGHVYNPGDVYPAEGFEADEKRIDFLSKVHPKYKKIFLSDVQEVENTDKFPKHVGGGTYELSNGEKVKGKEEAIQAEKDLKE